MYNKHATKCRALIILQTKMFLVVVFVFLSQQNKLLLPFSQLTLPLMIAILCYTYIYVHTNIT